ncbi:MAG TPA: MBL fold metallo-hydrolase [Puia sp.]|jgi:L-ascorbate metabolism protein UlaG (beta-lactamase superfamily)
MALFPQFGKAPAGERQQRIEQSPNYRDGSFQNLVPTEMSLKDVSVVKVLWEFVRKPANTKPSRPIPSVHTDLRALPDDQISIVWFGHSSYLMKIGKVHVLVDPVFSGNAAPFRIFAKAFRGTDGYDVDKLPDKIDILLLTHDHYDHLDYKTILKLKTRVKHIYTSLGVGAHLEAWGISGEMITELDWWEGCDVIDGWGRLTATPARHFSGRSTKRNKTLWSSFVLKTAAHSFFLGGDSGYGEHFKAIGDRFGPFDIAILECGQYGKYWPHIHMFPEQTVQAAQELKAKKLLPVHWGKFSLALHPWNEPIKGMTAAAVKVGQHFTTPLIGQPVVLNHHYPSSDWWDFE